MSGQYPINEQMARRQKILVVDDEADIRALLERRLSKIGYRVEMAANGLHALQKMRGGFLPDLIVCDVKMKGMDAVELLSELRKNDILKDVPVLIMTAFPQRNTVIEATKLGVKEFLLKPFQSRDLETKIQAILAIVA